MHTKAGDFLSLLQLAVALNLTYGGISYFIDSEIARARVCLSELKARFNSELDARAKLQYGSALLRAFDTFSQIQTLDKRSRPAQLVFVFAGLAVVSLALLIIATWTAQDEASPSLACFSIILAVIPSCFFAAALFYSMTVRKQVQTMLLQVSLLRTFVRVDPWAAIRPSERGGGLAN